MSIREKAIQRATELGKEYEEHFVGCAQSTFAAVVDALREVAGIELVSPEVEDIIFKGMVGLMGGVGGSARGSCGALTGAAFCISLAMGIGREEQLKDWRAMGPTEEAVIDGIVKKYLEEYGSLVCREVCFARFGMSWDFTIPEVARDFLKGSRHDPRRAPICEKECTIAKAAAWAVEKILDIKGIK